MIRLNLKERKIIRANVIAQYIKEAGYRGVVCFSCGNAARALRAAGLMVVEVSPEGPLCPGKWWNPAEIHLVWPDLFDATSGHLPIPLMLKVARALRDHLGELQEATYQVPTGSGETIVCLQWAYPDKRFVPLYGLGPETRYNNEAPLNDLATREA